MSDSIQVYVETYNKDETAPNHYIIRVENVVTGDSSVSWCDKWSLGVSVDRARKDVTSQLSTEV